MEELRSIRPTIKELLALRYQARDIQFFNQTKVHSSQAGNRISIARGRGMDFEEVRRYQPGDDIRLIHWPLTARLGKPYTKIYKEERGRAIYLIVDQSKTMHFGTRVCFKNVLAAKTAALLGWAAINHHEQVGGIIFNDGSAEYIKPRTGRQQLLNCFNLLSDNRALKHYSGGLEASLSLINYNIQSGSVVIIISDFFQINEQIETHLKLINKKAEIINIMVYDPLEESFPDFGNYNFTDEENPDAKLEISATKQNKDLYSSNFNKRQNKIEHISKQNQMQFIKLATNDNLVQKINRGVLKYGY